MIIFLDFQIPSDVPGHGLPRLRGHVLRRAVGKQRRHHQDPGRPAGSILRHAAVSQRTTSIKSQLKSSEVQLKLNCLSLYSITFQVPRQFALEV